MKIDIVLACGPKAESYAGFIIDNVLTTATTHEFNFIIAEHRCNVSDLSVHPRVKRLIHMPDDVPVSKHSGSDGHGRSVDECIKYVDTDIVLLMDYDIAFLSKGWDEWSVNQFSNPKIGVVGTEYSDKARGFPKYLNYPTIILCMMRTQLIHEHHMSFRPRHEPVVIRTQEDAIAYGRPYGFTVFPDTGVEIALRLRPAGVECATLKYTEPGVLPLGQNFSVPGTNVLANHMKSGSMQTQETIDTWKKLITDYRTTHESL
jgi:hypothetical protein